MSEYKKSNAGSYISERIDALRGRKTQKQIAEQAGYEHPNNISMIKGGTSKLPLDRVPALAKALECDVGELFAVALEQYFDDETIIAFRRVMTADLTRNEVEWIEFLRAASDRDDPKLTAFRKRVLQPLLKPSE